MSPVAAAGLCGFRSLSVFSRAVSGPATGLTSTEQKLAANSPDDSAANTDGWWGRGATSGDRVLLQQRAQLAPGPSSDV